MKGTSLLAPALAFAALLAVSTYQGAMELTAPRLVLAESPREIVLPGDYVRTADPKPKGAWAGVDLILAGDTVTASWAWKAALLAGDTGVVRFRQRPSGGSWAIVGSNVKTRGTTAARVIALAAGGDSVEVCVWVIRTGASPSPTVCGKRGRVPGSHPGADSLTVTAVIVLPDSVKLAPGTGKQFCAGVRLDDDRVILANVSRQIEECPVLFASVPGWTPEVGGMQVRQVRLGITIEGGSPSELLVDGVLARSLPPEWRPAPGREPELAYILRPRVDNAMKMGREWWLTRPIAIPLQS